MEKSPADILREARRLISEVGWTQGKYAKNEEGIAVDATLPGACSYCSLGAIAAVAKSHAIAREYASWLWVALDGYDPYNAWMYLPDWNDHPGRTREEVLEMFDKAIELAERRA